MLPALRGDLIINKQIYEGRTYYVIKDPVSLQYFRMSGEDYSLATLFDGRKSFGRIRDEYAQQFPHVRLEYTPEELNERYCALRRPGADAVPHRAGAAAQGALRGAEETQEEEGRLLQSRQSGLLQPLLGLRSGPALCADGAADQLDLDADFALDLRRHRRAGTHRFWMNLEPVHPTMHNFFSFNNLALIWVTTIIIKSIHELGHGLTCKHFGGEVHEVGVMLLVFTPYFFVNVSDSWVMPSGATAS